MQKLIEGTWAADDLRRAFVEGAAWWEFHKEGATMWNSDRDLAESVADTRYPNGKPFDPAGNPFTDSESAQQNFAADSGQAASKINSVALPAAAENWRYAA
jgi:hypothetical protein